MGKKGKFLFYAASGDMFLSAQKFPDTYVVTLQDSEGGGVGMEFHTREEAIAQVEKAAKGKRWRVSKNELKAKVPRSSSSRENPLDADVSSNELEKRLKF